jgi:hypothetical protein
VAFSGVIMFKLIFNIENKITAILVDAFSGLAGAL